MQTRKAYVLTCNQDSPRSQFSKEVLEKVGFDVIFFKALPHKNPVMSNKLSMLKIYDIIANENGNEHASIEENHGWSYVFEDDINVLSDDIKLDEIIEYENLTTNLKFNNLFFYLGTCIPNPNKYISLQSNESKLPIKIRDHQVNAVKGNVRGLHAIGLSKEGARQLIEFSEKKYPHYEYMDMILEKFSEIHPAMVIRYDLESYIRGHHGIFFQDRKKFPSTI